MWRYSKQGLLIDAERFKLTHEEDFQRLLSHVHTWLLTDSAKEIADRELADRLKELKGGGEKMRVARESEPGP